MRPNPRVRKNPRFCCIFWANLTRFSLKVREVPDLPVSVYKLRIFDAKVGLGRIVALYCRPSALYQIH